jgi:predicted nucleotidyltransferase
MQDSKIAQPALNGLKAPPAVIAALEQLREELIEAAGDNLAGLSLYGGLARGRFRPGRSDINVAVVLRDTSAAALDRIAPALRKAWQKHRVEPFVLRAEELPQLADVFPTKLLDIQARHIVLAGEDLFHGLTVSREHIRLRVEQELRNLELRLRRRYLATADDLASQAAILAGAVRPLALQLGWLLQLAGKPVPQEDRTEAIYRAAADHFQLDATTLTEVLALRFSDAAQSVRPADSGLFGRFLHVVHEAAKIADRIEVAS